MLSEWGEHRTCARREGEETIPDASAKGMPASIRYLLDGEPDTETHGNCVKVPSLIDGDNKMCHGIEGFSSASKLLPGSVHVLSFHPSNWDDMMMNPVDFHIFGPKVRAPKSLFEGGEWLEPPGRELMNRSFLILLWYYAYSL